MALSQPMGASTCALSLITVSLMAGRSPASSRVWRRCSTGRWWRRCALWLLQRSVAFDPPATRGGLTLQCRPHFAVARVGPDHRPFNAARLVVRTRDIEWQAVLV